MANPTSSHRTDKSAYPLLVDWAKAHGKSRIALYGAGKHTTNLIASYASDPAPEFKIVVLIDDLATLPSIQGIPVIRPDRIQAHQLDAIVVSSDSIEDRLYAQAMRWEVNIPIGRLHNQPPEYRSPALVRLVNDIVQLPPDWHGAGTMLNPVLHAIARWSERIDIRCSMETGTGKTSLLLSHISPDHTIFALNCGNSLTAVRESTLLAAHHVTFVEGPTQRTLPLHTFRTPLDMALIDGPHGFPFPDMEYYFIYPHLRTGAILIVDDIHIPTITNLFNVLKEDAMFCLEEVVETTAFFRRTDAPLFNPTGDGWWLQGYNRKHFPLEDHPQLRELLGRQESP